MDPVKINMADYAVVGKVAEGGMATLYEGRDRQHRRVAIRYYKKSLRFRLGMRRKFLHGVRVRRELSPHPNIVRYFGEGGSLLRPLEVMEFMPADSLRSMVTSRHALVQTRPLYLLAGAARALAHVHDTGYLHLDFKPENLLVRVRGEEAAVKLTDFDLCLPADQKQAPRKHGGSLLYEAPEYIEGHSVGPETDIFAFGVVAFLVCTGVAPFVGSVSSAIRSGRLVVRFPEDRRVPAPVQDFILRCLAIEPTDRYRSARRLAETLDELVLHHEDGTPSSAQY